MTFNAPNGVDFAPNCSGVCMMVNFFAIGLNNIGIYTLIDIKVYTVTS